MKRNNVKGILRFFFLFVSIHIIYILFVIVSNKVPHKYMDKNIVLSTHELTNEGLYVAPLNINEIAIKWDNYTTAIAFNIIWNTDNEHPIKGAIKNSWGSMAPDETVIDALNRQVLDGEKANAEYSRYWAGSTAFLRFLLLFWNISQIRILLLSLSIIFLILDLIVIAKKLSMSDALAFLLTYIVSGMFINVMCLTYFAELYIIQIAILVLGNFLDHEEALEEKLLQIFFVIGSVTMFFAWYSYPLLTLCFPMLLIIRKLSTFKERDNQVAEFFHRIMQLAVCSLAWCGGYIFTMLMKSLWCIAGNVEATAVGHMGILIGDLNVAERIDVIGMRWESFFNKKIVLMYGIAVTIVIIYNVIIIKKTRLKIVNIFTWILIGIYPCIWQFVFAGHARDHGIEGYLCVITIFSTLLGISDCFNQKDYSENRSVKSYVLEDCE